jgi:hypothetical protein
MEPHDPCLPREVRSLHRTGMPADQIARLLAVPLWAALRAIRESKTSRLKR